MFELRNLETDDLEASELRVGALSADSINGVTKEEFSYLDGVRSNIQDQLEKLKTKAEDLLKMWE